ncbi:MAG: DUF6382 domain-containing protein [Bacilli bacterium]
MNNTNIVINGSSKKLTKELVMGEQLNVREISLIDGKQVTGLLPAIIDNQNGKVVINYDMSVLISLNEYLKQTLEMNDVINLLDEIMDTFIAMQNFYLSRKKLVFDFNYIMINPTMKKVFLIYLPIMGFDNNTTVNNFLITLIENIQTEDGSKLLTNFEDYLKGNEQLELVAIKKFIDRLSLDVNKEGSGATQFVSDDEGEIIEIDIQPSIPNIFEAETPVIKSNTQEL